MDDFGLTGGPSERDLSSSSELSPKRAVQQYPARLFVDNEARVGVQGDHMVHGRDRESTTTSTHEDSQTAPGPGGIGARSEDEEKSSRQ
ncbi:hypothetical protein MMC16_007531 [Acarospora aff. strigata]|nr:hypothetical protein [Acarospora aff. strigata]